MLFLVYPTYKNGKLFFPFFVFGYIVYEVWQLFLEGSSFDWKDIIATIISGIIVYMIYQIVHNNEKRRTD